MNLAILIYIFLKNYIHKYPTLNMTLIHYGFHCIFFLYCKVFDFFIEISLSGE